MNVDITSLVLGVLAGVTLALAFAVPRIGRIFACILAVVLMTGGVGFLIWSIVSMTGVSEFRPIGTERLNLSTPVEALGLGAGLLAGGILTLVFSVRAPRR